jgi:hypothetical protein
MEHKRRNYEERVLSLEKMTSGTEYLDEAIFAWLETYF